MVFAVFDSNKPADETGYPTLQGKGWTVSQFATWTEALAYAEKWLGRLAPASGVLKVNERYDYSGCGDSIVIREIS